MSDAPNAAAALVDCLDLRHLAAPEPLRRALAAVEALPPGASLVLLTPLMPLPLLQLLELQGGLDARAELLDDGSARVVIRRL